MASQLWKNRNESLIASSVVSPVYGGVINETAMTSFPASVQGVHSEYPLVSQALLYRVELQAPTTISLNDTTTAYEEVLSEPPFFSKSLLRMPVLNYYITFMQSGARPMQHVLRQPNQHVAEIFTKVSFEDSRDLADQIGWYIRYLDWIIWLKITLNLKICLYRPSVTAATVSAPWTEHP